MPHSHDEVVEIEEPRQKATISWGWGTMLWRGLMTVVVFGAPLAMMGGISYFDKHNEEKFIKREEYLSDRNQEREIRQIKDDAIRSQLEEINRLLREQGTDIKAMLRTNNR